MTLASGGYDEVVVLWDLTTTSTSQKTRQTTSQKTSQKASQQPSQSKKSELKKGMDVAREEMDTEKPIIKIRINEHLACVSCLAWSSDSSQLASGSIDQTVRLFDAYSGKQLMVIETAEPVLSLSLSLNHLAVGTLGRHIGIWDVKGRFKGMQTKKLKGHGDMINALHFSPSGMYLASGSEDSTTRVWDMQNGNQVKKLSGHDGKRINSVCFSGDGQFLATGGADGTVHLWEISTGKVIMVEQQSACVDFNTYPLRCHTVNAVCFLP